MLPITVANLVVTMMMWYEAWKPPPELKPTVVPMFTTLFRTAVQEALPPAFVDGFKRLIRFTLEPSTATWSPATSIPQSLIDHTIWNHINVLGLVDRHETLIFNVVHEFITDHVNRMYAGQWEEETLPKLGQWIASTVIPWMFHPFARGARTR
jgi:anaphase-promoting complex subunit 2